MKKIYLTIIVFFITHHVLWAQINTIWSDTARASISSDNTFIVTTRSPIQDNFVVLQDSSVVFVGAKFPPSSVFYSLVISKTSLNGSKLIENRPLNIPTTLIWNPPSDPDNDVYNDQVHLKATPDGNFILVAPGIYVAKFDNNLNLIWENTITSGYRRVKAVEVLRNGIIILQRQSYPDPRLLPTGDIVGLGATGQLLFSQGGLISHVSTAANNLFSCINTDNFTGALKLDFRNSMNGNLTSSNAVPNATRIESDLYFRPSTGIYYILTTDNNQSSASNTLDYLLQLRDTGLQITGTITYPQVPRIVSRSDMRLLEDTNNGAYFFQYGKDANSHPVSVVGRLDSLGRVIWSYFVDNTLQFDAIKKLIPLAGNDFLIISESQNGDGIIHRMRDIFSVTGNLQRASFSNVILAPNPLLPGNNQQHSQKKIETVDNFAIKVISNPSSSYFIVTAKSNSNQQMTLTVTDLLGKIIERRNSFNNNKTIQIGDWYAPGIYVLTVMQGQQLRTVKLVKQ